MKKKVAIVGASIAGSICAIILARLGFDITVFEKSKGNEAIVDRGAGIWLPAELIKILMDQDILAKDFPSLSIHERPIYIYDAKHSQERLLTSHPIMSNAVNWMNLYEALKKQRPEKKVIYEALITGVKEQGTVQLVVNEQQAFEFDFCIFADGIHSFGRRYLFPESQPTFTNSIIWRGTLDRVDEETSKYLLGKAPFYVCERGHLLIYLIPSKNSTTDYRINWLFYESTESHALFKGDQVKASQNIIKGTMSAKYRQYLHQAAEEYFPAFAREIILTTDEPFTQAMHEMLIPSYIANAMCLMGDAGILLRPHTAVGATKAIFAALALGEQLKMHTDFQSALQAWNKDQYEFGKKQFQLGQQLGKLFVTDMPDWQQLTKQQMDKLWQPLIADCWYASKRIKGINL